MRATAATALRDCSLLMAWEMPAIFRCPAGLRRSCLRRGPLPHGIYADIERYRPTLFFSVPTNYAALLAHQREQGSEFDLSSVRHAISAGESLPAPLFERFKQRFGVEILDRLGLDGNFADGAGESSRRSPAGIERQGHSWIRGQAGRRARRRSCRAGKSGRC